MKDITPQIWQYFEEICRIPRPSKREGRIRTYIKRFSRKQRLDFKEDKAGNILITKPATQGKEHLKTVILQGHVDMVCEKDSNVQHNFLTDPINFLIDDGWIKARGTTLGADDGIGIAAMLAILADKDIEHGPLEAFFTVDEETGLTGAKALQKDFLTGEILINLDSEDEGELFIGCAGGIDTIATIAYEDSVTPPDAISYKLSITGMAGGHSGDDIHKRRGNAIKILGRLLLDSSSLYGISLSSFEGGNLRNAIPREATAIVMVNKLYKEDFEAYCLSEAQLWKEALISTSPNFAFTIEPCDMPESIIDIVTQSCMLHSVAMCPTGVAEWNEKMKGLVSTSSNLASIRFPGKNKIVIVTSQRSDNETKKMELAQRIRKLFEAIEAKVTQSDGYPGWTPNLQSPILWIADAAYLELFHKEPVIRAIHAGLECGLFLKEYPHLDMISFGPTIKDAHSPSERLKIATVKPFADLLLCVLERIPPR